MKESEILYLQKELKKAIASGTRVENIKRILRPNGDNLFYYPITQDELQEILNFNKTGNGK